MSDAVANRAYPVEAAGRAGLRQSTFSELVWIVVLLGFANGLYNRAAVVVDRVGFLESVYVTFEISIVTWVALWMALGYVRQSNFGPVTSLGCVVLGVALLAAMVPISAISWCGLTALALYLIAANRSDDYGRRAAWLLLAICISSFWTRIVARYFMTDILEIDAFFIAALTGTEARSNIVRAADGVTMLQVLEACSSFGNISLAFLGWMVARSHYGTRGFWRSVAFVLLSATVVVLINTTRIGIIALRPDLYDLAHGTVGASIASLLITLSIGAISLWGARR